MTETVTVRKDDLLMIMEVAAHPHETPAEMSRLNEAFMRCGEVLNGKDGTEGSGAAAPACPPGELARLELPGFVAHVGWISEETFAGAGVLVVRDASGTVVARVSPNAYRQIIPLPVPGSAPERPALTGPPPSWADEWDSPEDAVYDDEGDDGEAD